MGNNDKLGIITELADHIGELAHIGIIKRSIYLIQDAEWRGFDKIDRE